MTIESQEAHFETFRARRNLVDGVLRPNGVHEPRLLGAFTQVPREVYLPQDYKQFAYTEKRIPFLNRYFPEPLVLAHMIRALHLEPHDAVLDIGAGDGYAAALLCTMRMDVVAIEDEQGWERLSQAPLQFKRKRSAKVVASPLASGYAAKAPYKGILIEGGVEFIPTALISQLCEGGRIVAVDMSASKKVGHLTVWTKVGETLTPQRLSEACLPTLSGFSKPSVFRL